MDYGEKMIEALQDNRLQESERFFEQALESDSDEQLYALAESLYELGFLVETKKVYEKLLEIYPKEDELRVGLAEVAVESNQIDIALELLTSILKDSPAYPQSLLALADLYQIQGLYEVSEQKLWEAKELLPEEGIVTFALAELHFSMGKYAQAIRDYEELLEQGYHEYAGVNLAGRCGNAYSSLGDLEQAIPYLEKSVEESQTADGLFELAFTYMQHKEYKRASEIFYQLKELDPHYTSLYPYLAKCLEEEVQLEKAAEVIEEGTRLDSYNPELYAFGASIMVKLDQTNRADEYYLKAIELDPENESTLLAYTNFLLNQEEFAQTVEFIKKRVTDEEADPQFYWNLAIAQEALENYEQAGAMYQMAYPAFRQNSAFLKSYCFFLREEGNQTTIKDVLTDYLQLEPADDEMLALFEEINSNL